MVNTKKAKKNVAKDEVDSDVELTKQPVASDDEENANAEANSRKKDKKPKGKKASKQPDSESDGGDVEEITKKVKSLKVKTKKPAKKAGFDLLMADMSDDDQPELPVAPEPESDVEEEPKPTKKAADKKGKKAKRGKKDDEDMDQVLAEFTAELEVEYSGGKKAEIVEVADSKKGKKKTAAATSEAPAEENSDADEDENGGGGTVKTAAQKKKEKKERQKREAAEQKMKQVTGDKTATAVAGDDEEEAAAPAPKKEKVKKTKEVVAEVVAEAETAVEQDEVDEKKKKKKMTKAEREEEKEREKEAAAAAKKKKGGMSAAMVAAMQERLAKVKEEEEKAKREEEERIRREEELEDLRLEQLRIEAEKKEKKKLREQERKARLKAEGKLLTAKQKQDKARAQAMLDSLRAQGIELPEVGDDKPKSVRLGTRIRPNKKNQQQQQQSESQSDLAATAEEEESATDLAAPAEPEVVEEKIKDSWDASSSEDEAEEVPQIVAKPAAKQTTGGKKKATEESEESEDDDSDDDDSDDDEDSDDSDDDSDEDSSDEKKTDAERKREKVWERIAKRRHAAEQNRTTDNLRAAVVCVLGHVDTGKTKILDKLRRTNVQDGEAGGITQQIGATNVPIDAIKEQTRIVKGYSDFTFRLPGLLIIDTPGHESFSNLRSRGSSLCDIAILVVDIMHGLEPQTIESLNLLKAKKTPFIVALNKIDRLYNWETSIRKDVRDIIKLQAANTQLEFQQRTKEVVLQFAEQGLNAALFYDNPDPRSYVNLVPTSAITGEGMGNLLFLIVESCQNLLAKRLMYSEELLATVLEVKAIPGLGTTIDAILINGKLREGDTMVVAGTDGPIVTQIRSLLMPQPMKELRVKNAYVEYKEIPAAQGVKIAAKELEKAIAGLNVYVANKPDEVDWCRDEVAKELKSALSHIKLSGEGVYVQASTLGSLEALLDFLKSSKIPYANIRIGPVVKRDVMKASTMLVHDSQYATILAFDVKIERDAQDLADSLGVKIFTADIIYHLFDQFTSFREELKRKKREEFKNIAVFPCKLKILPQFIFNSRDPIVMGVMIEAGIVKEGTPICVPSKEFLDIGIVTSIECNHKQVESARKGQEVCIKIEPIPGESPKMFGRHFEETDILTSKISRQSIDACKDYFRDDLLKADWAVMVELKKLFQIL